MKKTRRKHAKRSRRLGSPPEAHAENFNQQHQGASESIMHARDAIRRGDCAGALEDLVDAAHHVGAAAGEAVASGMQSTGSSLSLRLKGLRRGLSDAQGGFVAACVRRGRG